MDMKVHRKYLSKIVLNILLKTFRSNPEVIENSNWANESESVLNEISSCLLNGVQKSIYFTLLAKMKVYAEITTCSNRFVMIHQNLKNLTQHFVNFTCHF